MEKFTLFHFYLIFFLLGLGYAAVSVLMGQILGGHGASGDAGTHELGGHDPGDHEAAHDHGAPDATALDSLPNISPWSPVTIATFVTAFGGVGLILEKLGFPAFFSFPAASISGGVIAAAVFYLFYRVFSVTQSTSGVSVHQTIGREAEVITAIPEKGVGEIAYVLGGRRFNAPARTEDGHPIRAHASVVISGQTGGTFFVKESVAERLKDA